MSSLGDIQSLYSSLQEIDGLLDKVQVKTETLRTEAGHARGELREAEYIFYRVTSLLGRMGLPKELDMAIMVIQRLILTIRMLHSALMFLNMGTPYGGIIGLISLASAAVTVGSVGNEIYDATRGK